MAGADDPVGPNSAQLSEDRALPDVVTFAFDGRGAGHAIEATEFVALDAKSGPDEFRWQLLRLDAAGTQELLSACDLDQFVVDALLADETRPRCTVHGDGVVLNLRGVNLNPGADPEDMVSLRLWIDAGRVLGVWRRPLMAVRDQIAAIERSHFPMSPGDLVVKLALRLADRAEPTVEALGGRIDELEEQMLDPDAEVARGGLADVRRRSIILRRYFVPQRDALASLEIEELSWLKDRDRSRLREAAERVYRLGEELDAIRDRAQVVHDQIMDRRAERMNRQMLLLSVVAAIFLPLGLITGLLGINVGGIPGAGNPGAFWIVCGILLVLATVFLLWFRRIGLFR
ncbi:zinc transporter ZntB [Sedimentitalea sp. JM2-8]|uniref:Zinc transporter ZntB n=1 Tax=Sedimentitalea xiamensis TaxID=3050037 RepID=A0ABT7FBX3_9RHOB|nr:zinc transporter ZntB [Sedimentitalea xiamensis]MDK3072616.1 zinc transporter ZntB [Sedimentitalea xiamensis]